MWNNSKLKRKWYSAHTCWTKQLNEEINNSKKHLLYLIDVHIFSEDDINLNTKTLKWPINIKPVFEQNTEIVEDCKARFEDNLQKKSDWITNELVKLAMRVQELEELGEINSIQQYTYEVRLIQNKLKSTEDTICWINQVWSVNPLVCF